MTVGVRVEEVASRNIPIVSADQSLAKVAEVMLNTGSLGAVTLDASRRPALVLTYRRLVKVVAEGASVEDSVAEHAISDPVVVHKDMSVDGALKIMRREAVRFLPVVDDRMRAVAVLEPRHAAETLWNLLDYGVSTIRSRARRLVALAPDLTIREAAKAMDENGVPEVLVRRGEDLAILREEDFLRAVARGGLDARIGDYAAGKVIKVGPTFDAKSAVELMLENGVRRLLVDVNGKPSFVTLSDLAFEAAEILAKRSPKETAFILVKTAPGKELDVASKAILYDGVSEVHLVTGEYDILMKIEAPSLRDIQRIVTENIRTMNGVIDTRTLAGIRIIAKKEA
ncbi:CBS domain-containing protein [Aeropyrum camini]|uniref:Transcriptional regulator n=1 Tax=Aeropyrum camini SY1 = JCM 12091 TaxID=1198449 RepID=U3TCX1_9CREN|nr:CBS domain-containing protein [Aeropyrum camini]BAN89818.1 transcriptional regulator [Aeropyrum camini SY1 = JCM 12091]